MRAWLFVVLLGVGPGAAALDVSVRRPHQFGTSTAVGEKLGFFVKVHKRRPGSNISLDKRSWQAEDLDEFYLLYPEFGEFRGNPLFTKPEAYLIQDWNEKLFMPGAQAAEEARAAVRQLPVDIAVWAVLGPIGTAARKGLSAASRSAGRVGAAAIREETFALATAAEDANVLIRDASILKRRQMFNKRTGAMIKGRRREAWHHRHRPPASL